MLFVRSPDPTVTFEGNVVRYENVMRLAGTNHVSSEISSVLCADE